MKTVSCKKCGHAFVPQRPQNVLEALTSERRFFDVAPELRAAEVTICPRCGHEQKAVTYRFFGFLTPVGMRVVIGLILGGMLTFAVWWRMRG